ncbi:MAG: glycosyltransferase [Leptospiraceae bacterium]|nr:glycosyltransferase [candidate division KSB1 bacterium]MCP5498212.1 glycosyltransferase [Leptospiraceae bacterium]
MHVLLISPSKEYPLFDVMRSGFQESNCEVDGFFTDDESDTRKNYIYRRSFPLSYASFTRTYWLKFQKQFYAEINQKILNKVQSKHFDLVLVYNDSFLLPKTLEVIKQKSKIAFYLGDSPFYTSNKPHFLKLLIAADFVFSPDSMWVTQLYNLGVSNIDFELFGFNEKIFFQKEVTEQEKRKYSSDLAFIGRLTNSEWGLKKLLFLKPFLEFDFKIYGPSSWTRWIPDAPELKDKLVILDNPLSLQQMNTIHNCAKLSPVDSNPGLLHGFHARLLDCIGSGILPLVEYGKDLDQVFGEGVVPTVHRYVEGKELAAYYLAHEKERVEKVKTLQEICKSNYTPEKSAQRVLDRIFK